jgi:hypothetical protein
MIQANELRLGNWLLHNGYPIQVESILDETINIDIDVTIGVRFEELRAIPLTPEILTACGFENGELKGYNTGYGDIGISADDGAVHLMFESQISSQSILYLHQLQNLIYCLTGEELNYNL